jgi:LmbE family N-acetylglucosaminyl deacetylase
MTSNNYIFLSPHFDDIALSCGGLVYDLTHNGHSVEIWTIMGGLPPDQHFTPFAQEMHNEWGMPADKIVQTRRTEDQSACQVMGARPRHFDWPDCIYRPDPQTGDPYVNNNEELFGKPPERELVAEIAHLISNQVPSGTKLVAPISLGNHIDHRAVRLAGEKSNRVDYFYADYPYILKAFDDPRITAGNLEKIPHMFTEESLTAWQESVLCYASQLTMFWRDEAEARLAIRNYLAGGGGRLWQKNTHSAS